MALHYIYLRIWMIKYIDMFYYFNNLIEMVKPVNICEEMELYFCKKFYSYGK